MKYVGLVSKSSILCLLLILFISVESAEDIADGQFAGYEPANDVEVFCPPGVLSDIMCLDCFTRFFCDGNGNPVIIPCDGSVPFCERAGNICSAKMDETWATCHDQILDQQLSCTSEGYFPDPSNCQQYFICPDPTVRPALLRSTYKCPDNYVYDSTGFKCKRKVLTKDCVTLQCTAATVGKFVTYPGNTNYYGYCKTATDLHMFKCPTGHNFNTATFGCEFTCTKEGYFPGATCRQYILCYKSGTKILALSQTCPNGYLWDSTMNSCSLDTLRRCTA